MAASRRRRVVLGALALIVVVGAVVAWQWYPIRVRMILSGGGDEMEKDEALRALGSDAIPAMIGVYESSGGAWHDKILLGQILSREPYRRVAVLSRGLKSESPLVARASAWLLVVTRTVDVDDADEMDRILAVAERWVEDRAWGSRRELAGMLKGLSNPLNKGGEPRAFPYLAEILAGQENEDPGARMIAASAMTMASKPDGVLEPLVTAARSDPSELVRAHSLQALAKLGWSDDLDLYDRVSRSEDFRVRHRVANALKNLGSPKTESTLARLLGDSHNAVRRSALNALTRLRSSLVAENAKLLREDSFMGVRGDLSIAIQELALKSELPVLIQGLLETEPDRDYNILRKTLPALYKLTGKHHGFEAEYFRSQRRPAQYEFDVMKAWVAKSEPEKAEVMEQWWEEFGRYDRRPALLAQLDHADPANVARAVRELSALKPDAPTPGFDRGKVDAAQENHEVRMAPFLDLVSEARAFQALPPAERNAHLSEWKTLHQ